MMYNIVQLDGRHSWHKIYRYTIEFPKGTYSSGVLEFDRARRWFNRTYGWSQDVETRAAIRRSNAVLQDADINLHWAYSTVYKDYRIYLKGNEELAFFQLVHVQSN